MDENIVEYFKVFSDPNRLEIIKFLLKGETCSCTFIEKLPVSQPTLSYHLKQIAKSGLAVSKKEGTWIKYYIDRTKLDDMIIYLQELRNTEAQTCKL